MLCYGTHRPNSSEWRSRKAKRNALIAVGAALAAMALAASLLRHAGYPSMTTTFQVHRNRTILIWKYKMYGAYDIDRKYQCEDFDASLCTFEIGDNWTNVDAVVVHPRDHREFTFRKSELMRDGPPLWIWWNVEPRSLMNHWIFRSDGFFHVTATYRRDSDIYMPYGTLIERPVPVHNTYEPRTKGIVWIVTNYEKWFRRVRVVEELRQYIHIDIYGRVPPEKCRGIKQLNTSLESMVKDYKFYLAFENSEHEDYITEKFWYNALENHLVPVVLGPKRSCYERYVPGDSFIHIDDFSSVKALAMYLRKVSDDYDLWSSYLNVHDKYFVKGRSGMAYRMCAVCRYVLGDPFRIGQRNWSRRYNMTEWFT